MMKYTFFLLVFGLPFAFNSSKHFGNFWGSPHKAILGITYPLVPKPTVVVPDLNRVTEELYKNFYFQEKGEIYWGLIKVVPAAGAPQVSGAIFKKGQPRTLNLFKGRLEKAEDRVWINFETKSANSLFGASKAYPETLTINHKMAFVQSPAGDIYLHPESTVGDIHDSSLDLQKVFNEKWRVTNQDAYWTFKLEPLLKNQLQGNLEIKTKDIQCSYGVLVLPGINGSAWFFTGDGVSKRNSECPPRAWYSEPNTYARYQTLYGLDSESPELNLDL